MVGSRQTSLSHGRLGGMDKPCFCPCPHQRPEQLAREICALDSSKEKLLKEGEAREAG